MSPGGVGECHIEIKSNLSSQSDLFVFEEIIVYFDWLTWLRFREDVKNILMGGPHYLGRLVTIFTIFRGEHIRFSIA